MIDWLWPWAFVLLPLPYLVYRLTPQVPQRLQALRMPFLQQGHIALGERKAHATQAPWLLFCSAIWMFAVLALARPAHIGEAVELPNNGRNLMLVVDISGSMKIEDMSLNGKTVDRLTLVKSVVEDFVKRRSGDRVGLILFGTNAYVQAPLTFDLNAVAALLNDSHIGFAGEKTAIGDAIGLSIKNLIRHDAQSRVMILLTDGENSAGHAEPLKAAQLADQEDIVIYTIGIGSNKTINSFWGFGGRNASAGLDEPTLRAIASQTQGQYFRATNQQDLERIYQAIDQRQAITQTPHVVRSQTSYMHWPLVAAGVLTCLMGLVMALRQRLR